MIVVVPLSTDAPIYYWPKGTIALIAVNTALFLGCAYLDVDVKDYTLAIGSGLHPLQWLTHNFLHCDVMHLIGNMIFLWAFGIVVEGKLGMLRFLPCYTGIGVAHGALSQILLLGAEPGHALGSSAIIYGLLGMCLIWAPRNDLTCFYFIWFFRVFTGVAEISILYFGILYIGEEVLLVVLHGLTIVSALGHSSGAFWGIALASIMVKAGWVDCEGWDLFSVLAGRHIKLIGERDQPSAKLKTNPKRAAALEKRRRAMAEARKAAEGGQDAPPPDKGASALERVRRRLDDGDLDAALLAFEKAAKTLPYWPAEADLLALIKALHERKEWSASVPLMKTYVRRFPQKADRVRLKLAQVLIRDVQRPGQALRVLAEIPDGALPQPLAQVRSQLTEQAARMQEDGVLELEGDD